MSANFAIFMLSNKLLSSLYKKHFISTFYQLINAHDKTRSDSLFCFYLKMKHGKTQNLAVYILIKFKMVEVISIPNTGYNMKKYLKKINKIMFM